MRALSTTLNKLRISQGFYLLGYWHVPVFPLPPATCLHDSFLLGSFLDPEDGSDMLLPKRRLSLNRPHGGITQKTQIFITTAERTSNLTCECTISWSELVSGCRPKGPRFDSRRYQIFWVAVCLERGPLSVVSINEELLRTEIAAPV
jgi:hypothetical protein